MGPAEPGRVRGALKLLAVAAVLLAAGPSACVYYNALYNAERLFEEGERYRRQGLDSLAAQRYAGVVEKAAKGYRRDPEGEWADDALLLVGRAYLRLGRLREARAALEEAALRAGGGSAAGTAVLSLGIAAVLAGDAEGGGALLNRALRDLPPGPAAAEGHLWRGRVLLEAGQEDVGWWDLDRAAEHSGTRVDAALTRVLWGIRTDNRARAREGMVVLLSTGEAGSRVDTVAALAGAAAGAWGPGVAAGLLAAADSARWEPTPRGKIRLARAVLLREAGDTAGAEAEVRRVAGGIGPAAAEARLELSGWILGPARDLVEARSALAVLLPGIADPRVAGRVEEIQTLTALEEMGFDDPLAWFAAGELARDGLGAPALARGLFLAYADAAPAEPWVAKALLAALAVSPDEGDRAWLRSRLEGRADNPYVLAARGETALGLEELEEELARRFQQMRTR